MQRAEFANRGPDVPLRERTEKENRKLECEALKPPTVLQRAVEAPPQWHCRRLPSRLARSSRLEGDSRGREKAEEEERLRWAGEVADFILSLDTAPQQRRARKTPNPRTSALRMCSKVLAATVRSYVRAWRPFWAWWCNSGNNQLPTQAEEVLSYLEQRAAEPCAPSVIRRTRAAHSLLRRISGHTEQRQG